ncbi:hypothetical protein [uncultured Lactobacillus sp.]|uniref:hypothetical protein n=1 Tax=uncultured Lactobacillus sp. TaxID=153152 RepID=UPI0026214318|nr:hypothetical protein [uncultured Lactobacillus sp.]
MKFKFKFKFNDFLLHLTTLTVILISIGLWVTVMTSDQRFSRISNESSSQSSASLSTHYRNVQSFYAPGQTYVFQNGVRYQVHDAKRNLPLKFVQYLEKVKLGTIEKMSTTASDYEKLLADQNYIMFAYPDQINFTVLLGKKQINSSLQFNRVFVPVKSKTRYLYFGNDSGSRVYRLKIKSGSFKQLAKYVKSAQDKQEVSFLHLKKLYVPFYSKAVKVKEYSYLISYQSSSYYASRLLGSSYRKTVAKNGHTVYTAGYSKRLQVPKEGKSSDHQYLYQSYLTSQQRPATQRMLEGAAYVKQLGLAEQDLRFFESSGKTVSYINYIEGYPIFANDTLAQTKVTIGTESVSVAFSSINLQIPIPYDGHVKTLPKTATLLKEMNSIGIKESEIEKIAIGYHIQADKKRSDLITLVPTYFIKVGGSWNSLAGWKKAKVENTDLLMGGSSFSSSSYSSSSSSSSESSSEASSSASSSVSQAPASGQEAYSSSRSQPATESSSSSSSSSSAVSASSASSEEGEK